MSTRVIETVIKANASQLKSALQSASTELDSFQKKSERTSKASAKSSMSAADGWDKIASGTAKAGLVAAAVGGSMVKAYADFDAQMSKVGAATNASAEDMGKLRQAAMDAGQEFGQFTSTEAAGALEELGKAGLNTGQSIQALSGTMGLAASDGMEVAQAAELTADALNMFGLKGDQATRVADRLAQGAGAASGSAAELGQGLSQVGAVANQFGVSMDDTVQSLALFAKNGIKGSDAGTSLKTMLMSLANPSEKSADLMKELGLNAFDAQGNFKGMRDLAGQLNTKLSGLTTEQKNAALATIFGSDAMRVAGVMAKEGSKGYDSMGKSMSGFGSAAEVANKKSDNLKGRFAELGGAWENLSIQIGSSADGPLNSGLEKLTGIIDMASRHQGATQGLAATAAGLTAVGLAGAGLVKTVQGAAALGDTLQAIGATKAGGIRGTASAIGSIAPVAIAAGAAVAGIEIAKHFNSQNTAAIDATRTSIDQLAKSAQAAKAGSTDYASAVDSAFAGTGAVFETATGALTELKYAQDSNLTSANNWIHSTLGMKTSSQALTEQVGKLDQQMAQADYSTAALQMQQVSEANKKVGMSTDRLVSLFPQYSAGLKAQASSMGVMSLSAQELEGWMGGRLPASVRAAAQAAVAAGGANAKAAAQILQNAAAAEKLSAAVNKMPSGKKLDIIVNGAQAQTTIDGFVAKLKGLPPKTIAELKTIAQTQGLDAAKKKLNEISGKKTTATVTTKADLKGVDNARNAILKTKGKTVTVGTKADTKGQKSTQAAVNGTKGKTVTVGTKADTKGQKATQGAVNSTKGKTVTVGTKADTKGQRTTQGAVNSTKGKTVTVATRADTSGASAARAAISSVVGKTVSVVTNFISRHIGQKADGGVTLPGNVEYFANGAVRENHVAQIAPAGAWRVWAEEETGGEAYIPLALAKRDRSMQILGTVAGLFGASVVPNAAGAVYSNGVNTTVPWTIMQTIVVPTAELAKAMRDAANSASALAKANKANANPAAAKRKADANYTRAVDAKNTLNARQKAEDLAYKQAILNAQRGSGGKLLSSLRSQQRTTDAALDKRIAVARRADNDKLVAALRLQKAGVDADFKIRIATAQKAAAGGKNAVKYLQQRKVQADINQGKAMAVATAKVTAAQKAKTAADTAAAKALEKAKAAAQASKDATERLAAAQKAMADDANQASQQIQSSYRSGDTLAEYQANAHAGALSLAELNQNLAKLTSLGLSKTVAQDLWSKGGDVGGSIAKELLAGGAKAIANANWSSNMLDRYGDALGWWQATGATKTGSISTKDIATLRATVQADTRAASSVQMSAEIQRLAQVIAQASAVNVYAADPTAAAVKVQQTRADALVRAGIIK